MQVMRVKDARSGPRIRQCEERFTQLVGDIFIGNEMVPDVIETPPLYPLELTYRWHGQRFAFSQYSQKAPSAMLSSC